MNFSIGLTGLRAAQRALELIGTNLANSTTEGYHRQQLKLAPLELGSANTRVSVGGVEIVGVQRSYNLLLEREHLRQQPIHGQLEQELSALTSIEAVLGKVEGNQIAQTLDDFFGALTQLTADPNSLAYAQSTVWTADSMTRELRSASEFLAQMKTQIRQHAEQIVGEINVRSENIAQLNYEIDLSMRRGNSANLLKDQRDQAIVEIAQMADIYISNVSGATSQTNVQAWGNPLVVGQQFMELEIGLTSSDLIGVGAKGLSYFDTTANGGEVGGLITLHNDIIPDLQNRLDTMAKELMLQINSHHAQGIGRAGSFTEMSGIAVDTSSTVGEWDWPTVTDGTLGIRLTDANGEASVHEINILHTDTLNMIIGKINAINGVGGVPANTIVASVANMALRIQMNNDYKVDFVPDYTTDATDPLVLAGTGGGVDAPTVGISGLFSADNQQYTFTITNPAAPADGEIGITDGLSIEVRNAAGEVIKTLNVGQGYAVGDQLEIENGMVLTFSTGVLNDGEVFHITGRNSSDSSGFLVAAGMNTFFTGTGATDIELREEFYEDPHLIATSVGPDGFDSFNIQRMAEIGQTSLANLGNTTIANYHYDWVSDIGQQAMVRDSRLKASDAVMQQLANQRDEVSGVDPNEEAAQMIIYERMFQSMSKFISVQDQALESLMQLL
ncbi:MAG: flagellar hook-associated protein FlgK [Phycisphaerae bacterium]|nr:flagellar hook-associated protein FlgK [Phycisphaerae bacterium]